jgi:hypothetical protein
MVIRKDECFESPRVQPKNAARFRAKSISIVLGGLLMVPLSGCAAVPLKAPCGPLTADEGMAYDTPQNDPCGEAKPVNTAFSTLLNR